jgi:hypothetical protein
MITELAAALKQLADNCRLQLTAATQHIYRAERV